MFYFFYLENQSTTKNTLPMPYAAQFFSPKKKTIYYYLKQNKIINKKQKIKRKKNEGTYGFLKNEARSAHELFSELLAALVGDVLSGNHEALT